MTTSWLIASIGLLPPLLIAIIACGRQAIDRRLIAVQLASSLAMLLLIAMSFAFDQASSIDVSVMLVLLTLPGTLVLALFVERWL
jgi:multicomponent Na+:H+ antiporter subunit F